MKYTETSFNYSLRVLLLRQFFGRDAQACLLLIIQEKLKANMRGRNGCSHVLPLFLSSPQDFTFLQTQTWSTVIFIQCIGRFESWDHCPKLPECPLWPMPNHKQQVWREACHTKKSTRLKGCPCLCYHTLDHQNPPLVVALLDKSQETHVCPAAGQIKTADVRNHH